MKLILIIVFICIINWFYKGKKLDKLYRKCNVKQNLRRAYNRNSFSILYVGGNPDNERVKDNISLNIIQPFSVISLISNKMRHIFTIYVFSWFIFLETSICKLQMVRCFLGFYYSNILTSIGLDIDISSGVSIKHLKLPEFQGIK